VLSLFSLSFFFNNMESMLSQSNFQTMPVPSGVEDTKSAEKSSPNALRELDILLRDATPDGQHEKQVRSKVQCRVIHTYLLVAS
jgi:hypothetical protein